MSIIQQIRDKAAWLVFGLIALSLVGFLLMDAFVGRGRMFGGNSNTVGAVNGEKLDYVAFEKKFTEREDQYKAQGYSVSDMVQQNIRDGVWKEFVDNEILSRVCKQLGLDVGDKELNDMLVGQDAAPDIRRAFTDPKTGQFDAQAAASTINQLRTVYKANRKTDKNYEQAQRFFEQGIPQIIQARLMEKYLTLVANSAYVPKWMAEKMSSDNSQVASIAYVETPYSTIADSTIQVTEAEIEEYVGKHKNQYKQDESRSISYVAFSAAPTSADSAATYKMVADLKGEFATTTDIPTFLSKYGSDGSFDDAYVSKSKLQVPNKDSIMALPKNGVFGVYQEAGTYRLAKLIDVKTMPDSVRARHILVETVDQRTGQPTMEDSVGKMKIDSIKNLIDHGQRFDSLAAKLSDDAGSKAKGGDLGYFAQGTMVKEFNDFCFTGKTGDKKIVKSQFGYHYIEITDQKGFEPAYKIAYFTKKIDASNETDQNASGYANQFAGESRNQKAFDENAQKGNLLKLQTPDILPTDINIQGLGVNRQLVRWVFDANLGDVSEPFSVGDKYVVAVVTQINHEGTMSVAKARPLVEPIIRNQKKAQQIIKKIGTPTNLEAVAAASGEQVRKSDSLGFASPYIPNVGQEGKVVGSAFDKEWVGKPISSAIEGSGGVFYIRVVNVGAKPNYNADIDQLRQSQQQMQQTIMQRQAIESLKSAETITDNRGKFY
jgi:peptidyl-prolyl cis-trans isomerase D